MARARFHSCCADVTPAHSWEGPFIRSGLLLQVRTEARAGTFFHAKLING
jgi:hypothetical protein